MRPFFARTLSKPPARERRTKMLTHSGRNADLLGAKILTFPGRNADLPGKEY
jgi:hypothetical protein